MAFNQAIASATIFMEASSEGHDGMVAVAHVLANRRADGRWGGTLSEVCLAPQQFSCWNTNDPNRKRMAKTEDDDTTMLLAQRVLDDVLWERLPDPTQGATHYYSVNIPAPSWAETGEFTVQIGKHRYYINVP